MRKSFGVIVAQSREHVLASLVALVGKHLFDDLSSIGIGVVNSIVMIPKRFLAIGGQVTFGTEIHMLSAVFVALENVSLDLDDSIANKRAVGTLVLGHEMCGDVKLEMILVACRKFATRIFASQSILAIKLIHDLLYFLFPL